VVFFQDRFGIYIVNAFSIEIALKYPGTPPPIDYHK